MAAPERRRSGLVNRCRRWLAGELHPERNRYRDVLLLVGLAIVVYAVVVASQANSGAISAVRRVQEGRATSITITCAIESAISEAGEQVIRGPQLAEGRFTRNLERLGYPSAKVRQAQAQRLGAAYVADIDRRVSRELAQLGRRTPAGLIRRNGTIDCRVLQRVSAVPNPR